MKLPRSHFAGVLLIAVISTAIHAEESPFDTLLSRLAGGNSPSEEILPEDKAFRISSEIINGTRIALIWHIADGYYLYRDKFGFAFDNEAIKITDVSLPGGVYKDDPDFGGVMVNYGSVDAILTLDRPAVATVAMLHVRYQGCKEDTVCYPPADKYLPISLAVAMSDNGMPQNVEKRNPAPETATPSLSGEPSEQDRVTASLLRDGLWRNVLVFFGFGVLLALTPCVFPMVPILSGIIVGQGASLTVLRAFSLSLIYVLAMAVSYAVIGVIAGALALNLAVAAQNAWAITAFSAVFVALAFSMFGVYELQLPSRWQSRLAGIGRGGGWLGVAVMGGVSAIVVAPCITPPLAGALLYISQTGNAVLGGAALFAMGLGMGVPLLIFGASAGKLLPKAGAWMESIKHFFAVLMLAVAIWFMERVLPPSVTLVLWATLLIVIATNMGALTFSTVASRWQGAWRGLGVVLLVYGVVLIVGAAGGTGNVLQPLAGFTSRHNAGGVSDATVTFRPVKGIADVQAAISQAAANGRPVMLDFYADWCITCKEMEYDTFPDQGVRQLLENYELLKADVTGNDALDKVLLKQFNIFGPPAILFFGRDGVELSAYRVVGFMDAARFSAHLQAVLAES